MIRGKTIGGEAHSVYSSGKEFAYDHVSRSQVVPFVKGTSTRLNIKVNAQKGSVKSILMFVEPYAAGTRDAEKNIFRDLTKVSVTINSSPNMLYNNGIERTFGRRSASSL